MSTKLGLSVLFIYVCALMFSPALSSITYDAASAPTQKLDESLKPVIKLALNSAVTALSNGKQQGSKCQNETEKAAWSNCLKLYGFTIDELNRTLVDSNIKTNAYDTQLLLSSALTNTQTCKDSFNGLGDSHCGSPFVSNNVSRLISNSLEYLNSRHASSTIPPQTYKDGFPSWVKASDRKLLKITSPFAITQSADVVVAQDGSGNYHTIKAALDAAKKQRQSGERFVIHIKSGVYAEYLEIGKSLSNIMLVGDGIKSTIITGSRNSRGGYAVMSSATVVVEGKGFIARGITFRNSAGPEKDQAVALRVTGDQAVFYYCGFEGYQDTLYVHNGKQFYKECDIYGTVDIIFGNAAVVFQNCNIYVRKPLEHQKNVITAQGRTDRNQNTGIVIQHSRVTAASDLASEVSSYKTYLGRPWKKYSRTVFMETYLDSLVDPAGWLEWDGDYGLDTLYYGEYLNSGPGSLTNRRVQWGGHKVITNPSEASKFTVANFINGGQWLPATGVPYIPGL